MKNAIKRRIRKQLRRGISDRLNNARLDGSRAWPSAAYQLGESVAREFMLRGQRPTERDLAEVERVAIARARR